MAEKIASMYAEVSANTSGLKKGLGETKTGLEKASKQFGQFKMDTLAVWGAIGAGVIAAKKAFEFGKEGIQLEYVRGKFDKLAVTVNTTSDALLADLRRVTKGLVADSVLIASATDFMSLGLAKTSDQVIRLTRVAGTLNMDMNQLVLTLANKTTMRFDQLGVAIDGFDERLKKMKDSGMDVNAAFTEAFLQQAEAQISKVGDISDTAAGKIAQLEAASQNLADEWKLKLAPAALTAVNAMLKMITVTDRINDMDKRHADSVVEVAKSYKEYIFHLAQFGVMTGKITQYQADLMVKFSDTEEIIGSNKRVYEDLLVVIGAMEQAQWDELHVTNSLNAAREISINALRLQSGELELNAQAMDGSAQAANKAWGQFYGLSRAIMAGKEASEEAKPAVKSFLDGVDRNIDSPIAAFIADLKFYRDGGAIFTQKFQEIKTALEQGKITPQEAQQYMSELYVAVTDFQEEIGQIDADEAAQNISDTLGASVKEAKEWIDGTDSVTNALTAVASKPWWINIYFKEHNKPEYLGGGGGGLEVEPGLVAGTKALGGPVMPNGMYLVGERGPELFVPNTAGQIIPNDKIVGGAGSPLSGGDVYVVQNFYDQGAAALGMAYVETLRGQRLDASMGR